MADWLACGLEDDMRRRMFNESDAGRAFALATIIDSDGGPRPLGSQMVITETESWGFLSGGCIEADVALHGREVLASGAPRTLVYGRGSPFIDMRLPCGRRLEVMVERVEPDDEALASLRRITETRQPASWESNGRSRLCGAASAETPAAEPGFASRVYDPAQRLLVVGSDPFALAIAGVGAQIGWEIILIAPFGPAAPPPFRARYERGPASQTLQTLAPDPWTAIAVATHDLEVDEEVLVPALRSPAGYVGVLGSRARLPERHARLRDAGLSDEQIARLRAPIGLPVAARAPWEVGIAVAGEIIATANGASADTPHRFSGRGMAG